LAPIIILPHFCILAIPLSIFVSYYFLSLKKSLWAELLMLFIIGLLIYNQVIYP
jgi:sugar phosphate permease